MGHSPADPQKTTPFLGPCHAPHSTVARPSVAQRLPGPWLSAVVPAETAAPPGTAVPVVPRKPDTPRVMSQKRGYARQRDCTARFEQDTRPLSQRLPVELGPLVGYQVPGEQSDAAPTSRPRIPLRELACRVPYPLSRGARHLVRLTARTSPGLGGMPVELPQAELHSQSFLAWMTLTFFRQ